MKKAFFGFIAGCLVFGALPVFSQSGMKNRHGDERYSYSGLHSGNMIRGNFYNDGEFGRRYVNPNDIGGEWPINSGHDYMNQMILFIGAEVKDENGEIKHIMSEGNGCTSGNSKNADSGDSGPNGEWWSMAPLPGLANDKPPADKSDKPRVAMSHWDWSWPSFWPDKTEDKVEPGWPASWNGYFGKNVLNADQESYYVMDDYNNREFAFYPDSTDSLRRGLGIRATVRGFQWSNVLVEDVLFILYDAKNIGTANHSKMNFGVMSGPVIGNNLNAGGDGGDDGGEYNLVEAVGYHTDKDDIGSGGWIPVGVLGLAFFESPGNPFDGIDNDADGDMGTGPVIDESMFSPRVINAGEPIVLIDYMTYDRTVTTMPADGEDILFQGRTVHIPAGLELEEVENNLFDDNLNGIIDENNGSTFGQGASAVKLYLFLGRKYINYITNEGNDNLRIDEKRDDGIDNDKDWDPLTDDVGLDGVPKTGDFGENDGKATSGWQPSGAIPGLVGPANRYGFVDTGLPGEPRVDKTDIHESDMIGLTAFNIYTPWTLYPLSDDENLWNGIKPGFLNALGQFGDTDILMGSGYFPLKPEQIERFSIGVVFGLSREDMFRNKKYAQKTYDENYNFSKAPYIPTVTVIAGDKQVTLMWDDVAENSLDPITGKDFEGYRIYRSTDPAFKDMTPVTDGYGSVAYRAPVAQFDMNNGVKGYSGIGVRGIRFWLGDDTGLEHVWVDTTVKNGQKYYYAVTSYDRGDDVLGIAPTEVSKYISIGKDGKIDKGKNVVIVRPEAPSAGYVASDLENLKLMAGSTSTGVIQFKVVNTHEIQDNHRYRITFEDTLILTPAPITPITKNFTLTDVTDSSAPDTLIKKSKAMSSMDQQPVTHGFQLKIFNESILTLNTVTSAWSRPGIQPFLFSPFSYGTTKGNPEAADYRIEFGQAGMDTARAFMRGNKEVPGGPVNFTVYKLYPSDTGEVSVKSKFGLYKQDAKDKTTEFSAFTSKSLISDQIVTMNDENVPGFMFTLDRATYDTLKVNPGPGDYVTLRLKKPYLSHDVLEFVSKKERVDDALAKQDLEKIKVVPNPYVVANSFEPLNPYTSGRGPREIHFTHLPTKCTIKIFNIRGQPVATLEHDSQSLADGTEIWNMLTKDQLDIAYGVYVFHVDAGKLGTKVGKFAVIK